MGLLLLMGDSGVKPLLDSYTAAVGYSLRRLRSAYSGAAIRVRRSSDNAEQDIGFSGIGLDTSSLLSFCGAGNGFVTTWYDQVGSNNATSTTASQQPQIVSGGALIVSERSNPAMQFNDASGVAVGPFLQLANFYANTQSYVGTFLAYSLPQSGNSPQVLNGTPKDRGFLLLHFSTSRNFRVAVIRSVGRSGNGSVLALNTTAIRHDYADRTAIKTFVNTTVAADIDIADGNENFNMPTAIRIGNSDVAGDTHDVLFQEFIGFTTDQSANQLAIRTNMSNYWRA